MSLACAGFDTTLIVCDGNGDGSISGVQVVDCGKPRNRKDRLTRVSLKVYQKAREVNADVYHFHEPDLIWIGLLLKIAGKLVVYDVHEDWSGALMGPSRSYLPKSIKVIMSKLLNWFEKYSAGHFSAIVAATPTIAQQFILINPKTITVNNYPILAEFDNTCDYPLAEKSRCLVYIGGLSVERGLHEMISATEILHPTYQTSLTLAGWPSDEIGNSLSEIQSRNEFVDFLGVIDREGVRDVLNRASIGLLLLHHTPNHIRSQPVKLYEYMAAGLPVIASNFEYWQQAFGDIGCITFVDPKNTHEITAAIKNLLLDPDEAKRLGELGRRAVYERYNWSVEQEKLVALYNGLLK